MKIIINGYCGAMGQVINSLAKEISDFEVVGRVDKNAGFDNDNFAIHDDLYEIDSADVLIDFSTPKALNSILNYALDKKIALVIGTTGFNDEQLNQINEASKVIPIFHTSNMSLGVNLMVDLVKKSASILKDFDIEIIEAHHNKKIDAPSGTAFMIAESINDVFDNTKSYQYGREGNDSKRNKNEIGIHSLRAGTIVGEHTALFAGEDELIEIKHTALSKKIFAKGALTAAKYIYSKESGLYNMSDIINQ